MALARDRDAPAIVRASALRLLRQVPRAAFDRGLLALIDDAQPLLRVEALQLLDQIEPAERWRRAHAHLDDDDRLVRLGAADAHADCHRRSRAARAPSACAERSRRWSPHWSSRRTSRPTRPSSGNFICAREMLRIAITTHDGALLARHTPSFERLFPDDESIPLLHAALQQR